MLRFSEYCQLMENHFEAIILGDVPSVKTLGIVTAENPGIDNKLTKIGNERKNKDLEHDLRKMGYAPIQMQGKFAGVNEKPFLILNIPRNRLVELGKKYRQHSVIYAERRTKLGGKIAPLFEFMYIQNGRTVRKGVLGIDHPKNLIDRDCYFNLGKNKFNIHFSR